MTQRLTSMCIAVGAGGNAVGYEANEDELLHQQTLKQRGVYRFEHRPLL